MKMFTIKLCICNIFLNIHHKEDHQINTLFLDLICRLFLILLIKELNRVLDFKSIFF